VSHLAEARLGSIGEEGIDGEQVVAHDAVANRAGAARVVTGHAADGGAAGGGDIDREPQPGGLELPVQVIQHDAGLDRAGARLSIERHDPLQVLAEIDDQRAPHGLPRL
jgi:hypothetical protein